MELLHETVPLPLELEDDKSLCVAEHTQYGAVIRRPMLLFWWLGISENGSSCTASYVTSRDMLLILQSLQLFVELRQLPIDLANFLLFLLGRPIPRLA